MNPKKYNIYLQLYFSHKEIIVYLAEMREIKLEKSNTYIVILIVKIKIKHHFVCS